MDFSPANWMQLVTTVLAVLAFSVSIYSTRRRDIDKRLRSIETQVDQADRRLVAIETELQARPAQKDLHALQVAVTEIGGELKAVRAAIEGHVKLVERLDTILERQENFLMTHK